MQNTDDDTDSLARFSQEQIKRNSIVGNVNSNLNSIIGSEFGGDYHDQKSMLASITGEGSAFKKSKNLDKI